MKVSGALTDIKWTIHHHCTGQDPPGFDSGPPGPALRPPRAPGSGFLYITTYMLYVCTAHDPVLVARIDAIRIETGTQTDAAGSPALLANRCTRFTYGKIGHEHIYI